MPVSEPVFSARKILWVEKFSAKLHCRKTVEAMAKKELHESGQSSINNSVTWDKATAQSSRRLAGEASSTDQALVALTATLPWVNL